MNPALPHPSLWRATSLASSTSACLPSGFAALDAELPGGGWPTQGLCEILSPGAAGWRLLVPGLRGLWPAAVASSNSARTGRAPQRTAPPLLLINPPHTPHLPGLNALGLGAAQLLWIQPADERQALWVLEQAIRAQAASAILAWLSQAQAAHLRRLQAAALHSSAPVFVLRPLAAQQQSSAAPLRLLLQDEGSGALQVRVLKRRGPAHSGWLHLPASPPGLASLLTPTPPHEHAAVVRPAELALIA